MAPGLGLRVGGLQGPAGLGVAALQHGVAAAQHGLGLDADGAVETVAERALGVAMIEDDEAAVPVAGHVDAVLRIGEDADLGDAGGGLQNFRFGIGGGGGLGAETRRGAGKQHGKQACGRAAQRAKRHPMRIEEHAKRDPEGNELRIRHAQRGWYFAFSPQAPWAPIPVRLQGCCCGVLLVGTTRFELATSPTPRVRSTRLSHVPTQVHVGRGVPREFTYSGSVHRMRRGAEH